MGLGIRMAELDDSSSESLPKKRPHPVKVLAEVTRRHLEA